MAGTRTSGRKAAQNEVAGSLLSVLKFLSIGQKSTGDEQATHTVFQNGWGMTFNGVIACGMQIGGLSFDCMPNTSLLMGALNRVGKDMELTIDPLLGLHVVSGTLDAWVPTASGTGWHSPMPDTMVAVLDDRFTQAFEICSRVISDSDEKLRNTVVFSRPSEPNGAYSHVLFATDGVVMVQADCIQIIPAGFMFPKALGVAIKKSGAKPVGFGVGNETFTVWLDNGGYIRTQRFVNEPYQVPFDRVDQLMVMPSMLEPPKGFFEAVDTILPFSSDGTLFFKKGQVGAEPDDTFDNFVASVTVKGMPDGVSLPGDGLSIFSEDAKTLWLGADDDEYPRAVIRGELYMAVIAGRNSDDAVGGEISQQVHEPTVVRNPAPIPQGGFGNAPAPDGWGDMGDDIPF